ncbi:LpqN/LpqT family lipoprotein [uncultured Mycobacterium sp.]|uniref:LpqN/LpqT family lipoprotein n=1 Tax=uncultured Mycobacterium sp. TaxID=171292 RepID=UPI0035C993F4
MTARTLRIATAAALLAIAAAAGVWMLLRPANLSPQQPNWAAACADVQAPTVAIPAHSDAEPRLRIPTPEGWQRSTMLDSELIRYVVTKPALRSGGFTPNVVVTLESVPGGRDPRSVLDDERQELIRTGVGTNLAVTDQTLCGYPAQMVRYTAAAMGAIPPRPATVLTAAADLGNRTYAVAVTIQTTDPDNPVYRHDAEEILTGFQMLPPSGAPTSLRQSPQQRRVP